ncbi:hypothetical protein ISCGN_017079 [Ixodes scapularis]
MHFPFQSHKLFFLCVCEGRHFRAPSFTITSRTKSRLQIHSHSRHNVLRPPKFVALHIAAFNSAKTSSPSHHGFQTPPRIHPLHIMSFNRAKNSSPSHHRRLQVHGIIHHHITNSRSHSPSP